MKVFRAGAIAGLLACAVTVSACSSSGGGSAKSFDGVPCSSGTLNAAGSTAQANAMQAWIKAYQGGCGKATINYNGTGSGAGVSSFTAKQVDFAGSDSALDPTKGEPAAATKACGSTALDLPMVVGPIAVAYKLKGVSKLTLNGETIAEIFAGKIKKWNDSAIASLNSGVTLPNENIQVFYRSDSSGTTQNFEKYLAATAPDVFTSKPDKDSSKAGWVGQGKAKSQGVADAISSTEGGIGYDEFSYAVSSGLSTAAIDNGGGAVTLSKTTASAAAEAATRVGTGDDYSLKLDYATKTPGAYPIILVTYEIVCSKYSDSKKGTFVKNFLTYTSGTGQNALAQLGYAPLPSTLLSGVKAAIAKIS